MFKFSVVLIAREVRILFATTVQYTYNTHTIHIQYTYNTHTIHIQYTYNTHTIYTYNTNTIQYVVWNKGGISEKQYLNTKCSYFELQTSTCRSTYIGLVLLMFRCNQLSL